MEKNIKEETIEKIKALLEKRKEIIFAYIFGSYISEENFNDIDIGVYLRDIKDDPVDYSISLSVDLEKKTKKEIDVKVINSLPLSLKYHITKGLLLFTKDKTLHENFVCTVWKEYIDFKYFTDLYIKELKNVGI